MHNPYYDILAKVDVYSFKISRNSDTSTLKDNGRLDNIYNLQKNKRPHLKEN